MTRKKILALMLAYLILLLAGCNSSATSGIQAYEDKGVQHFQFKDNLLTLPEDLKIDFDYFIPTLYTYKDENDEASLIIGFSNHKALYYKENDLTKAELDELLIQNSRLEDYEISDKGDYRILTGNDPQSFPRIIIGNLKGDIIIIDGVFDSKENPEKKKEFDKIGQSIESFSKALEDGKKIYLTTKEYKMENNEVFVAPLTFIESSETRKRNLDEQVHSSLNFMEFSYEPDSMPNKAAFYNIDEEDLSNQGEFEITPENLSHQISLQNSDENTEILETEESEIEIAGTSVIKLKYKIKGQDTNNKEVYMMMYIYDNGVNYSILASNYDTDSSYLEDLYDFMIKETLTRSKN